MRPPGWRCRCRHAGAAGALRGGAAAQRTHRDRGGLHHQRLLKALLRRQLDEAAAHDRGLRVGAWGGCFQRPVAEISGSVRSPAARFAQRAPCARAHAAPERCCSRPVAFNAAPGYRPADLGAGHPWPRLQATARLQQAGRVGWAGSRHLLGPSKGAANAKVSQTHMGALCGGLWDRARRTHARARLQKPRPRLQAPGEARRFPVPAPPHRDAHGLVIDRLLLRVGVAPSHGDDLELLLSEPFLRLGAAAVPDYKVPSRQARRSEVAGTQQAAERSPAAAAAARKQSASKALRTSKACCAPEARVAAAAPRCLSSTPFSLTRCAAHAVALSAGWWGAAPL